MPKYLLELADQIAKEDIQSIYGATEDPKELASNAKQYAQTEKLLLELMTPRVGKAGRVPKLSMQEAVHSADFKILFPRIVTQILQRPQEPIFIGQNLLARTINVDGSSMISFPSLGAIRAFELTDTQEPPEQDPSFSQNITELRTRRFGLKLEMTNDVIRESQWDIVGLYVEQAGNAMMRKKEELIFREYELRAHVSFDNSLTDTSKQTTGVKSDGVTKNGTFDHDDLLTMIANLGTNGYTPTTVILHPLAWAIWARDPYLRFQLLHKGGVGQVFGDFGIDPASMQAHIPFGLDVVVSPFQTLNYNTALTTGVTGTAENYTTITVVDRNSSLLLLQRTPMSMVQFENPLRDIQTMMFQERYGLAVLDGGRSATVAKNVRIDQNFKPVYTIRQVTAS